MLLKKEELIKPQGSTLQLSDGIYTGVIVGYVITHKVQEASENRKAAEYDAIRFAVQIHDDEDTLRCVQTNDMKLSLNERSNLFKQLASWMKAASPDTVWNTLESKGFMNEDGDLDLSKFVGKPVGLLNTMTPSKKSPDKLYPSFTFIPAKAKDVFEPDPTREDGEDWPLWLKEWDDVIEEKSINGFSWKIYAVDPEDPEMERKPSSRPKPNWSEAQKTDDGDEPISMTQAEPLDEEEDSSIVVPASKPRLTPRATKKV